MANNKPIVRAWWCVLCWRSGGHMSSAREFHNRQVANDVQAARNQPGAMIPSFCPGDIRYLRPAASQQPKPGPTTTQDLECVSLSGIEIQ
jgi:hypothetical protein